MTDAPEGRTMVSEIRRYQVWIGSTIAVVALILFAFGPWAASVGALLGLLFFLSMTRRIRGAFRRPEGDVSRPSGVWTLLGIQVATVAVVLFVTLLIGGTVVDICFAAMCTQTSAFLALIVLVTTPKRG